MFFTSPTSNITPAIVSVAMSRSDSRDSTTSNTSYTFTSSLSAYHALAMSTSSSWPQPLSRTSSNTSSNNSHQSSNLTSHPSQLQHSSASMRRGSSSNWIASPYRSCMLTSEEPSSYISDDDLLFVSDSLPVESIPNLERQQPQPKREMTTEEQMAMLRELQDREAAAGMVHHYRDERRKVVRFASHDGSERKARRPSTIKRKATSTRRALNSLNGPQ